MVRIVRFPSRKNPVPEVKGPIRCHKCQMMCRDAAEYLSHKCEPKRMPGSTWTCPHCGHGHVLPTSPMALRCPFCKAEPRHDCETSCGGFAVVHVARIDAAAADNQRR